MTKPSVNPKTGSRKNGARCKMKYLNNTPLHLLLLHWLTIIIGSPTLVDNNNNNDNSENLLFYHLRKSN